MALLHGAVPGVCDICHREVGHVPKHRKSCALKHGKPVLTGPPTQAELDLIERAGAHAQAETTLDHDRRFQKGVTDLDVARVLHFLDRGGEIIAQPKANTWLAPAGSPLKAEGTYTRRNLSVVVNEAVRLGLAYVATERTGPATWLTYIAPSLVHLRSRFNRHAPACSRPQNSIKRYRLLDQAHLSLVDCQGCVDIAST